MQKIFHSVERMNKDIPPQILSEIAKNNYDADILKQVWYERVSM